MESVDQDFVEIQADEEMIDLDEENVEVVNNRSIREGDVEMTQVAEEAEHQNSSKQTPVTVSDEFNDAELDSEAETEDPETNENAEQHEQELMSMPSLHSVISDMSQLKQKRRVLVHPIKVNELGHPKVLEIISKVSCEEIKLHFVRPQDKPEEWHGILLMHFGSTKAAGQATENLKAVRSDLNIKTNKEAAYSTRTMEQWAKEEKGQKRWTETLLWVKDVGEDVTENQLFEAFPDAEDVTLHYDIQAKKEGTKTKEAFVVYRDGESAQAAAKLYESNPPQLNGHPLKVHKYHIPQETTPKGLLKLKERRLVLKYLEKLQANKELLESGERKVPDWCTQRLEKCQSLLDRDGKVRKSAGLGVYTLGELRALKGIKVIRGKECKETLQRLGVLPFAQHHARTTNQRVQSKTESNRNDGGKSKIRSLLQLRNQIDNLPVRSQSRYKSLLGEPKPLYGGGSGNASGGQWGSPALSPMSQLASINHAISQLSSISQAINQGASASQLRFLQPSAAAAQSLINTVNQESGSAGKKTPLLASPGGMDLINPFGTSSSLASLFDMDPPEKILRLDAFGSYHVDYKERKQGGIPSLVSSDLLARNASRSFGTSSRPSGTSSHASKRPSHK